MRIIIKPVASSKINDLEHKGLTIKICYNLQYWTANGMVIDSRADPKIPMPNTFFEPNFRTRNALGICVIM